MPALNVREPEKSYEMELAVPGYAKQDFEITVDNGILSISVKKEEEKNDDYLRKEFSYNAFTRTLIYRKICMKKRILSPGIKMVF